MEKNMNRNLCRLEAGGDGRLYSVSFEAELTGEHVTGMLEAVRRSGDRGAASAAHAFLKRSGLGFSGFSAQEMFPEGRELMHLARAFLHGSREEADRLAGDAGRYFLCLDPLQREPDGSGAGCFLAARRAPEGEGFRWDVAGQEFCPGSPEECFSAVRIAGAGEGFRDSAVRGPVFPSFGCVDMAGVLLAMEEGPISAERALKAAVR